MEEQSENLVLRLTASYTGAIGYGEVYKCHVAQVISGNLDERELTVTILANDKTNLAFVSTHLDAVEFEMRCRKSKSNEPYSLMPISGFVDNNRTSWEIDYLKDVPVSNVT